MAKRKSKVHTIKTTRAAEKIKLLDQLTDEMAYGDYNPNVGMAIIKGCEAVFKSAFILSNHQKLRKETPYTHFFDEEIEVETNRELKIRKLKTEE